MITKTAYLSYLHCPKRFWLEQHRPERAAALDAVIRRRMHQGTKAGRLARSWYPGGWLIPYQPQPEEMAQTTAKALADGEKTLFEATFLGGDLLIKADILRQEGAGWHLIEVKAANSVKKEHLPDVAFQLYVLQQTGLELAQASVMYLNRDCHAPDLDDLYLKQDVSAEVQERMPQVAADVAEMRHILTFPQAPEVDIGRHCFKSGKCPFYDTCWPGIEGLTLFNIPRLNSAKEAELRRLDVLYLAEVPQGFPLTVKQREYVDFYVQEKVEINHAAVQKMLNGLHYPLYFFDFETIGYAVPLFDGTVPYQQVPFQYSLHVLSENGTLMHHEFLHTHPGDPRPALLDALFEHIGPMGHIIVYNALFERGILQKLAHCFPQHAPRLEDMIERLWDQLLIFRNHYRHHGFCGSNSLKSVLPVVVPDLSYDGMAVADGLMAQVVWEEMIALPPGAEKERLVADLLAYCHLDTRAMVEIHRVLSGLV